MTFDQRATDGMLDASHEAEAEARQEEIAKQADIFNLESLILNYPEEADRIIKAIKAIR
jgi:hypothetical protein